MFRSISKNTHPESVREYDSLPVYPPMSCVTGMDILLIPGNKLRPLGMSMEEAVHFALATGITGTNQDPRNPPRNRHA